MAIPEMPVIHEDECIRCGLCAEECPDLAVFQAEKTYRIDRFRCSRCGICVTLCPAGCIKEAIHA